jgi:predicted metalloprotease with PDZ domain
MHVPFSKHRGVNLRLYPAIVALALGTLVAMPVLAADMTVEVDASQVAKRILHSHVHIPVSSTKVELYYPKWIPGDHAPLTHVEAITELVFHAGGKVVPWRRNLTDAFAFELEVPAGTDGIDADFDIRLPAPGTGGFSVVSATMMRMRWGTAFLYPAGRRVQDIAVNATLRVPAGWGYATALPVLGLDNGRIAFQPTNLEALVDAPVLTGLHMLTVDLTPGSAVGHQMAIAAENTADLPTDPEKFRPYARLIDETKALFGSEHYRNYKFLVAASDYTGRGAGFEHGESSDNGVESNYFRKMDEVSGEYELLPHEYAHSWSGKYRRPADLTTNDFQQPAQTDLLWVYEGVTAHLGYVLAARSGLWTADQARDYWAEVAAIASNHSGRTWRSLQDSADAVPITMVQSHGGDYDWQSWVGALDYYEESALVWLEAGAIISQQTGGRRTLDNFMAAFYGGKGGRADIKTYTAADVVASLNQICPYDWDGFFKRRLNSLSADAPLGGLERSGWQLVYDTRPNTFADYDALMYTSGLKPAGSGRIVDVDRNTAAYAAGLIPGMKIVKINGQKWTLDGFRKTISDAKAGEQMELATEYAGQTQVFKIAAGQGMRYPHLERIPGTADLLSSYLAPHVESGSKITPTFSTPR